MRNLMPWKWKWNEKSNAIFSESRWRIVPYPNVFRQKLEKEKFNLTDKLEMSQRRKKLQSKL